MAARNNGAKSRRPFRAAASLACPVELLALWHALLARTAARHNEAERTALMAEISGLMQASGFPPGLRAHAMELIGKLARRHGEESPCTRGLDMMRSRVRARHG